MKRGETLPAADFVTKAEYWLSRAAIEARRATCEKARCGAVLVLQDTCVGMGFNGPAPGALRRCDIAVPSSRRPRSDRTCCVHAEWRALIKSWPTVGATLVFARVDDTGQRVSSGLPYCTVCSRLALECGVKSWVLEHSGVACEYDALAYDELSHQYDDRLDVQDLPVILEATVADYRLEPGSWLLQHWSER